MLGISASSHIPNASRMLFAVWRFYSLALNTVFQTFPMMYLVDPGLEKKITTEG
jgi:hypothetical protein